MRIALLLVTGLLVGCTTTKPLIVKEPKDVNIAVRAKCIKKEDVPKQPEWPLDLVDLDDEKTALPRVVNAARLERKQRIEYTGSVEKVLKKCSE